MKRLLLAALILITQFSQAQTYLTIIGTQHYPTDNINSQSIYEQLNKIKPDIVLMEQDSSTMNDDGEFLINSNELEPTAVKRLEKDYNVIVRPFDYKNRNKFYNDNQIFTKENRFFHSMDSVYSNKLMDSLSYCVYQNMIEINTILNTLNSNADLKELNMITYQQVSKLRQDLNYNGFLGICYRVKYMQQWAKFCKQDGDFWTFRNNTMVDNILKYCDQFKGKKIVVLTGAMHKYFLSDAIGKKQKANHIILKDFWEYN
ncbi:MAG TPA: hypothetical protein VNX40_12625 [Mucilaginibacter sp.]|nr:hypothetical protein [Mucilaginibacter sp.]